MLADALFPVSLLATAAGYANNAFLIFTSNVIENPLHCDVRQNEKDCFLFALMSVGYDSSRISQGCGPDGTLPTVVKSYGYKKMRIKPKLQVPAAEHLASDPPLTMAHLVMFPALKSTGDDDIG